MGIALEEGWIHRENLLPSSPLSFAAPRSSSSSVPVLTIVAVVTGIALATLVIILVSLVYIKQKQAPGEWLSLNPLISSCIAGAS